MRSDKRDLKRWRLDSAKRVRLDDFDPGARPLAIGEGLPVGEAKAAVKQRTAELARKLGEAQDRFYALRRDKLLLVLQGMDTSGKDGTIRSVFQAIDPLGVRTVAYKAPTEPEKDRDFLWRHHRDVPGRGEIVIFNRSHYEAVLIEYVHGWIDKDERKRRFSHIRAWERLLAETGTTIIKCYLHISRAEQRRRLQERIDDPQKHWKFNPKDLDERKLWSKYQQAYETMLEHTAMSYAPWFIVPADSKTHRSLMVTEVLLAALQKLAPDYPAANPAYTGLKVT